MYTCMYTVVKAQAEEQPIALSLRQPAGPKEVKQARKMLARRIVTARSRLSPKQLRSRSNSARVRCSLCPTFQVGVINGGGEYVEGQ